MPRLALFGLSSSQETAVVSKEELYAVDRPILVDLEKKLIVGKCRCLIVV